MPFKQADRPVLAVDVVLFSLPPDLDQLSVLLHRREHAPFAGAWALPGVAVHRDETLDQAARRALHTKAELPREAMESAHLEQLATFDALYRDPRGRTVSVAHMGLLPASIPIRPQLDTARWCPIAECAAGSLPFDHDQILHDARVRLQGKLRYTNIAARLLPEAFRIEALQRVYEAVLAQPINRANFRNKLLRIGLIERVGVMADAVGRRGGRPPHLYRFTGANVEAQERDFL